MELAEEVLWLVDEHDAFPRVGAAGREDAYDDVHGLQVDLALGHEPPRDLEADAIIVDSETYLSRRGIHGGAPVRVPARSIHARRAWSWPRSRSLFDA